MIKKLSLYNFESHENTTITFNENLNLIVGISNSGKSSLIRAMGVVVNNNWSKEMVRTGCDFCRVTLETERGWVEAERGEKINRWRCKEGDNEIQSFKNVGTKVPDLATRILGMGERDRGGDIKELPNFQFQLEKHYMLSEIGEKKATSNMIARMMDNAIGLGGMEDLIKEISTDLLKDKKWLTEKQNEIIEIKSTIIEELIFNNYEKLIKDIEHKNNHLISLQEDIEVADKYKKNYDNCLYNKQENDKIINQLNDITYIQKLYDEIIQLSDNINLYDKVYYLRTKLDELQKTSNIDILTIKNLQDECFNLHNTILLCEYAYQCEDKLNILQTQLNINVDVLQVKKDEVFDLFNRIKDAEKILFNARELWKQKTSIEKEYKGILQEIKKSEQEFEKLKDEIGICPLCGSDLKENKK